MKLVKILLKTTLFAAALALPPLWLVGTNSGLNTALTVGSWFVPDRAVYEQATGTIWANDIKISNIRIKKSVHTLQIAYLTVDWRQGTFTAQNITGFVDFIPHQEILLNGKNVLLKSLDGEITFKDKGYDLKLLAAGNWQKAPLNANLNLTHLENAWIVNSGTLNIGENTVNLQPVANGFNWDLKLIQPGLIFKDSSGFITANGLIENLGSDHPSVQAQIQAKNFNLQNYAVRNLTAEVNLQDDLKAPLKINVNADDLKLKSNTAKNLHIKINGSLEKHTIFSKCKYEEHELQLTADGNLNGTVWKSKNLRLNYKDEILIGDAVFDTKKINGEINLHGKIFEYQTSGKLQAKSNQHFVLNMELIANAKNNLKLDIEYNAGDLNGTARAHAEDLSIIMELLPDVTRLKGLVQAEVKLTGTIDKPVLNLDAHVTKITATMPALGIKIKPMELHLHNEGHDKIILTGSGKMRRGPGEFTIEGFIEPFKPNMPHAITLIGKSLEFINNDTARLIASNKLNFAYDLPSNRLDIIGDIDIEQGHIKFDKKKDSTVKSKDVVFTDTLAQPKKSMILINPQVNLRISEGVHFSGFGLDADITGKLDINQRHNAIYGSGRITIKQGTYKLPGQTLEIQKGRLLYPPGTLLANPTLDIKMMSKNLRPSHEHQQEDMEVFVRGTAQAPSIHEVGISNNKDRAISQAMLAGSSVLSKNMLQEKLKITELGVTSKRNGHQPEMFDDPTKNQTSSLKNKDLVIGRPLGNRLYLQYLHSISEANQRVRLQYALNKNWAIGVESGNQGSGADLSFSIETD